jgi:diaminopimelate decarboxylase
VSLAALAREFGTPLYVYSQRAMLDSLAAYQRALAGRPHLVCYAMKANSNLAVLQTFARAGCGFDIVSGGELARVLAAGGRPGAGGLLRRRQDSAEMRQALAAGVRCFNVESARTGSPVGRGRRHGPHGPISLRVNPDVDAGTHPYISTGLRDNKFGVAHEQARAGLPACRVAAGLKVAGIDCHIGSQITQIAPYLDALDRRARSRRSGRGDGISLQHIDLSAAAWASPTPTNRRRRPTCWWRHARSAWTHAAMASAKCCSNPAVRWSATPACC